MPRASAISCLKSAQSLCVAPVAISARRVQQPSPTPSASAVDRQRDRDRDSDALHTFAPFPHLASRFHHHPRGIPSPRCAITPRWISDVPPASVEPTAMRYSASSRPPSGARGEPCAQLSVQPAELHARARDALRQLRAEELRDRRLLVRDQALRLHRRDAIRQHDRDLRLDRAVGQLVPHATPAAVVARARASRTYADVPARAAAARRR